MKQLRIDHPRLKRVFREAFEENARVAAAENEPGETFNRDVMREIRRIAAADARRSRFAWIPRIAWRLAPVACGVLLALTVFMMRYDQALNYDMAAVSLTDPIGFHETNLFKF